MTSQPQVPTTPDTNVLDLLTFVALNPRTTLDAAFASHRQMPRSTRYARFECLVHSGLVAVVDEQRTSGVSRARGQYLYSVTPRGRDTLRKALDTYRQRINQIEQALG